MVSTPCPMVYSQIPSPTLISDGVLHMLIFKDGQSDLHVAPRFPMMYAMTRMLGAL